VRHFRRGHCQSFSRRVTLYIEISGEIHPAREASTAGRPDLPHILENEVHGDVGSSVVTNKSKSPGLINSFFSCVFHPPFESGPMLGAEED